jgi:Tfp pilus assembly protein PilX
MMNNKEHNQKQQGAVSLFIVIFTTLLMVVITVSFVQLMSKDQRQATVSDLSKSAYDSAQAGVEDAKRLLILHQACLDGTADPVTLPHCTDIANALTPLPSATQTKCSTIADGGIVAETNHETIIQQTVGDGAEKLDQAYTCVKLAINTGDYLGNLQTGESTVVPLRGVSEFKKVSISWFSQKDITTSGASLTVGFPSSGADVDLPRMGPKWQYNYPALLRSQLIQTGSTFKLDDFNDDLGGGRSNTNTLFLYPSSSGLNDKDFAIDGRYSPSNAPQPIKCKASLASGGYACTVDITLPDPSDGDVAHRQAYLNIEALYNPAHFRIQLKDDSNNIVKFAGVQPEVDSTGRANDLFRRVVSRIILNDKVVYPESALDVDHDLCKTFTVTTNLADYDRGACTNP